MYEHVLFEEACCIFWGGHFWSHSWVGPESSQHCTHLHRKVQMSEHETPTEWTYTVVHQNSFLLKGLSWLNSSFMYISRDPSTSSQGIWTLQTQPKHLLRRYDWISRDYTLMRSKWVDHTVQRSSHSGTWGWWPPLARLGVASGTVVLIGIAYNRVFPVYIQNYIWSVYRFR